MEVLASQEELPKNYETDISEKWRKVEENDP